MPRRPTRAAPSHLDVRDAADRSLADVTTVTGVGRSTCPELRHERFGIGEKLGEGGMGVVYRARRHPRRPRRRAQADEGLAGRHGPAAVRARVPLDLGIAPPALRERLRLRRARRRAVLHHGIVPGKADHQPRRQRLRGNARLAAAGDARTRLHPPPGHYSPRHQAFQHPGAPDHAAQRPVPASRPS